jgi:uncharacterized protein YjbI with pentapeptide repeats
MLNQADLRGADLRSADLRDADLANANLQCADLVSANLTSADLNHAHLSGANLDHADLTNADLRHAVLGDPEIRRTEFWQMSRYPGDELSEVIWAPLETPKSLPDYVRYDIPEEELHEWRERVMGCGRDNYRPATLRHANLADASLERAICDRVSFSHSRLVRADLSNARLVGADFTDAVLANANVFHADMRDAAISRAARKQTRRKPRTSWADLHAGAAEVYTYGFDEYLNTRARDSGGDIHVTLIHGTFAQQAEWVDVDSALVRQLRLEASRADSSRAVHQHPYDWSGKNTFRARREAVDRLRGHLARVLEEHPTGMHCAVGHSHGGTVLLHALRDPHLAQRLARVVCISTPFIRVSSTSHEWRTTFFAGLKSLVAIGLFAAAVWLSIQGPNHEITAAHPIWFALLLSLAWVVAFLALSHGIGLVQRRWEARSKLILCESAQPQLPLDQAILIRTAADEAGFVLGLGATFA